MDTTVALPFLSSSDEQKLETTVDQFLGGIFEVEQPRRGHHRAGTDAVLLAAALSESFSGRVMDLGAGVGVAGFAAAARLPCISVCLVELDPVLVTLARRNLGRPLNAFLKERMSVLQADITAPGRQRHAQGLIPEQADHVLMNPPYYPKTTVSASPHAGRRSAHLLTDTTLDAWIRTATDVLVPRGSLTIIFPPLLLKEVKNALEGRFGGQKLFPIFPRPGFPAHRLILRSFKGSRASFQLFQGLVVRTTQGVITEEMEAIQRQGAGIRNF